MLSIAAMSGGQCDYYTALAREDYYLEGGEPEGKWLGVGAERLGLEGTIPAESLRSLFQGFSPDGDALVQNAGKENRQPGWDLTFSAPKSVSVLWSQADQETQRQIQAAHAEAVAKALAYLEEEAAFSRTGKAGSGQVRSGLVVATFEHGTSRAFDPQLHTHCLVLNIGVAEDGKSRTILSKPFYEHKMAAGALYRVELAYQLEQRLGLHCERQKSWFELPLVPKPICEHFSKRRKAIEEALGSRGLESASAAAIATLATREVKDVVPPRQELFRTWQEEAKAQGFLREELQPATHAVHQASPRNVKRIIAEAVHSLAESESHFTERDLVRRTAELSQGRGLSAADVRESVRKTLQHGQHIVHFGKDQGIERYTTKELFRIEEKLLSDTAAMHEAKFRPLKLETVKEVAEKRRLPDQGNPTSFPEKMISKLKAKLSKDAFTLNAEQQEALLHATRSPGRIKVISGFAGTGKTAMLQATREAFEREGYRVLGCAHSGIAAKKLEEGSGIASDTLRLRLMQLYPKTSDIWKHHAKQVLRAALQKKTFDYEKLKITAKTVMVLDEASMVGTRDCAQLVEAVKKGGGILICVGDNRQLPAIDAGGAFGSISRQVGEAKLQEVTRQKDAADREAVKDFAQGNPTKALLHYAEKGQLTIEETRTSARNALLHSWLERGGAKNPRNHVIFTGTNEEVSQYNKLVQAQRLAAGELDASQSVATKQQTYFVGDRLLFLQKSRSLGVENGDVGTIVAVKNLPFSKALAVRLDDQTKPILVPLREYTEHGLGYAFTTHKLQGSTVSHAYVHVGEGMTSRELAYVQASRHKETLNLFTDKLHAGPELTAFVANTLSPPPENPDSPLIRSMKTSRTKTLAHDVLPSKSENTITHEFEITR